MLGVLWSGAWTVAVWALLPLHALLQWLAAIPGASLQVAQPPIGVVLLALAGGLWMALPWPWRLRCLGIPLLVPALGWQVPRPMMGHFEVWAPDVGQGNVVWVRTARHSLLYDAGPRYAIDSDAGHRVIVPWLRRWHERLDLLVLSHRDSDHTGGAAALLAQQNDLPLLSSLEAEHPLHLAAAGSQRCAAGQSWAWDGVQFEVLHPPATDDVPHARSNAISCVLRIRNGSQTVLLAGDIEAPQEQALLQRAAPALKADVLLVPHHGSKTSSTEGFIDAVAPRWAWVQAGYRNRFGHPASVVVDRYRHRQIQLLDSVHCGAMHWRSDRADQVHCERDLYRYWHHKAP
jgi:competence protein ComEC